MKPNGETPPQKPVVLGSPDNPITDPELLRLIEQQRRAVERESKYFIALRNALAEYDLARDQFHLATIQRDLRMQQLAESQGNKPTS